MDNSTVKRLLVKVERSLMHPICEHLKVLYQDVHLPSHDISHHIRVWKYCKELIEETSKFGANYCYEFIEQSLVASLFHDTGLIIDKSECHGHQSRLLCQEFFKQNQNLNIAAFKDALFAIEHHDDKSIKDLAPLTQGEPIDLLSLVTTADDLDAFGYIGVFRYLEIYALRGVSEEKLPVLILNNLRNRINNFEKVYVNFPNIVVNHLDRYKITSKFFNELSFCKQYKNQDANSIKQISNYIVNSLITERLCIDLMIQQALDEGVNVYFVEFFSELKKEIERIK